METCVVTLGSEGCAGANRKGETFRIPAFSGQEIIDTTGAGDVFHGGFLFAHSQGWDLRTCASYASAVSFIKCTALGGRVGIPSRKTVEQFLKDRTIDRTDIELRTEHYRNVMRFE
jgi:sugar/nucleoside kinase (ribokinase family)